MRDEHDRDAVLGVEGRKKRHDLLASRRVKTARRLVCEKQLRARDDGARNRDALLLSARELRRRMVLPVQQAYAVERGPRQLAALGGAHAAVEERKLHVLKRRRSGEKIEALKDEAEVLAPQERTLVARQALDVHSAEEIRARRRAVERADDVHGRRLARARRAHDSDEFALVNRKAHAAQGLEGRLARAVALADVDEFN